MTANRFRFRGWDEKHGEMLTWKDLTHLSKWDCRLGILTNQARHHLVFMQSTGLVGCNGVEIFEGDLVKLYPSDRQMMSMTIVVWVDGRLELAWEDKPGKPAIDSSNAHLRLTSLRPDFYEVVGNIYEEKP